jgi:hypothetical protein
MLFLPFWSLPLQGIRGNKHQCDIHTHACMQNTQQINQLLVLRREKKQEPEIANVR